MEQDWQVCSIRVDVAQAEAVADWLRAQFGVSPIVLEKPGQRMGWLEVYLETAVEAQLLGVAVEQAWGLAWALRECPQRDWAEFWKIHFQRILVGERFEICPPWEADSPVPAGRDRLVIEPGMSFGTGKHFTTRFCLETLERVLQPGMSVFDAGTGSGILAIAAARMGAGEIRGVDVDATALSYAQRNLEINGVADAVNLAEQDLLNSWIAGTWDLVIANIYGHLLVELAPNLVSAAAGPIILSGIRAQDGDMVAAAFAEQGWVEMARDSDPEWCGLVVEPEAR